MEIKIKDKGNLVDATVEMIDGVMVVSPVISELAEDYTKFKDGDVLTYTYTEKNFPSTVILKGEVDKISKFFFIEDYCGMDKIDGLWTEGTYTDAATSVRYATEEEKQKLFDRLLEEDLVWNEETKKVEKWKPKWGMGYWHPFLRTDELVRFVKSKRTCIDDEEDEANFSFGWVFRTEEQCQEYVNKLNKAIASVKL